MPFLLSSKNIFKYLFRQSICIQKEPALSQVELKIAINFNLLLSLHGGRKLFIKQERHNQKGKTSGEFLNEWQIHELLQRFPYLDFIRPIFSEALHFDAEHSSIIFSYLNDYCDLAEFCIKENVFPTAIATSTGAILATIHHATFNRQKHQDFFSKF